MVFGSGRDRSPFAGKENTAINGHAQNTEPSTRSRSFSFLGRSKSSERVRPTDSVKSSKAPSKEPETPQSIAPRRSFSGKNKLVKKQVQRDVSEVLKQAKEDIPAVPPVIPSLASPPDLQTFGGGSSRQVSDRLGSDTANGRYPTGSSSVKNSFDTSPSPYGPPMPPVPGLSSGNAAVDPYARTESMTNRGRYSYASSIVSQVNGPRRVRRRKDPTPFNILVIGASNAGKTSFIDFLCKSCELPAKKQRPMTREGSMLEPGPPPQSSTSDTFTHRYLETELQDGERIGLTLWDSEGLEKNIIDLQLRELSAFIEGKFEETFSEENKVIRSPGKVLDTHIHCVFLLLDPLQLDMNFASAKKALQRRKVAAGTKQVIPHLEASILDERMDLQVLRSLRGKTTIVPIITKADTVTGAHMRILKRAVWNILKEKDLDPLEALGIEVEDEGEDDDDADTIDLHSRQSSATDGLLDVTNSSKSFKSVSPARSENAIDESVSTSSSASEKTANGTAAARAKLETGTDPLPPLPLSVLTPDPPDIHHNEAEKQPGNVGRSFAWGFADPYDDSHCDFVRLKEIILSEWRTDLREKSQQVWYENWRTARLRSDRPVKNGQGASPGGLQVPKSATRLAAPRSNPNMASIRERTPVTQKWSASPLLSHPVRDVSPAISMGKSNPAFGLPTSPPPPFAPPPAPREFSFAGRERVGSFSSPVRNSSPATRMSPPSSEKEVVTALPAVMADEVGVAK